MLGNDKVTSHASNRFIEKVMKSAFIKWFGIFLVE